MFSKARPLLICLLLLGSTTGFGCSSCDDPGTNQPPKINPNNTSMDMNNTTPVDMDGDMLTDMTEDMKPDMDCEGNECVQWKQFDDCERVQDLGTLDTANSSGTTLTGTTENLGTLVQTECSNSGDVSAEYIYAFKVNQDAFLDFKVEADSIDFVAEFRFGKCEAIDAQDVTTGFCDQSAENSFRAFKDVQYFLVVEAQNGLVNGPFTVDMTFTPAGCNTAEQTCVGKDLLVCEEGTTEVQRTCGTDCMMDSCTSDTCDNAIELSGTGTFDYQGDLNAFTDSFEATDFSTKGCVDTGGNAIPTPGAEQIFKLSGLKTGQLVRVEANDLVNDQNDNVIFIMDQCGAQAQCFAVNELADKIDWEVPSDGDYVVVIDNLSDVNKNYKHTITISDP